MITVTITREELLAHKPCKRSGGVELFDAICTLAGSCDVLQVTDWTPLHSLWLVVAYPEFRWWLLDEGMIPDSLRGANLSRANLFRAYLSRANLSRANLSRANLSRASLSEADLFRANLSRVNLLGAGLSRADLSMAGLSGAYRPKDPLPGWVPDAVGHLYSVEQPREGLKKHREQKGS